MPLDILKKFEEAVFPADLEHELMVGEKNFHRMCNNTKNFNLNKEILEQRKSLWNQYARENDFMCIGDVFGYTARGYKFGPYMVVDILPKGYAYNKFYEDRHLEKNCYAYINLNECGANFDEDGYMYKNNFRLEYEFDGPNNVEVITDDIDTFIEMQKAEREAVRKLLVGKVMLTHTSFCGFSGCADSYHLAKIDEVYGDLGSSSYYLKSNERPIELYKHSNAGTYSYFDWKIKENWSTVNKYADVRDDGSIGFHYFVMDGSTCGFIVDFKESHTTYASLKKKMLACDGVNERYNSDPFDEVFSDKLESMHLQLDFDKINKDIKKERIINADLWHRYR